MQQNGERIYSSRHATNSVAIVSSWVGNGHLCMAIMMYLISIEYSFTLSIRYLSIATVYSMTCGPPMLSQFVVLFPAWWGGQERRTDLWPANFLNRTIPIPVTTASLFIQRACRAQPAHSWLTQDSQINCNDRDLPLESPKRHKCLMFGKDSMLSAVHRSVRPLHHT